MIVRNKNKHSTGVGQNFLYPHVKICSSRTMEFDHSRSV